MTSTEPTQRRSRRSLGRGHAAPTPVARSAVGEMLREAREIRGVDLYRVERDTKIRSRYLAALENGDFADLPGDVYARGFLRNYATYLGLDADEIEEEWREEAGEAAPVRPTIAGPQPITMRRRIVFQQSHVYIAMVAIIVLVVASFFGFQLSRYLSHPSLAVEQAGSTPVVVQKNATTYVLKGTATARTTVRISQNGGEPKEVVADDDGKWTYQAILQPGRNQFDITATNLDTNNTSQSVRLIVIVPTATPSPPVPEVAFTTPAEEASFADGVVTVTGTAVLVASVRLTATLVGPPLAAGATPPPPTPPPPSPGASSSTVIPTPSATPSGSPAPTGTLGPSVSTNVATDGTFILKITLGAGRWQLTLVGDTDGAAPSEPVSRIVNIPYRDVRVTISVKGGQAWILYHKDGQIMGMATYPDGWSVSLTATRYVCMRSAAADRVYFTFNGTAYGPVSSFGGARVYIDITGPRYIRECPPAS
jgi:cytoskeletal protein RodZ